jgi:ATP-dependent Clp protease ATP-binding subunit ClpA
MPKVNVYLPDKLAESVRAADVPLSAVCQRALREALQGMPGASDQKNPLLGIYGRLFRRARVAVELSIDEAERLRQPQVGSAHLLVGILLQRTNAAVQIIESLGISRDTLLMALETPVNEIDQRSSSNLTLSEVLSPSPIRVLEAAATASVRHAYNVVIDSAHYPIGCEHILIGLLTLEEDPTKDLLNDHGIVLEDVLRSGSWVTSVDWTNADEPLVESNPGEPSIRDMIGDVLRRLETLETERSTT